MRVLMSEREARLARPGSISASTGQSSCSRCPAGEYQVEPGKTACKTCQSTSFSSYCPEGSAEPRLCPEGTYSTRPASTTHTVRRLALSTSCKQLQHFHVGQPPIIQQLCTWSWAVHVGLCMSCAWRWRASVSWIRLCDFCRRSPMARCDHAC